MIKMLLNWGVVATMKYIKKAEPVDSRHVDDVQEEVADIIRRVREKGQKALIEYNTMFDGNTRTDLRISEQEVKRAYELTDRQLIEDLRFSIGKVNAFARRQKETLLGFDAYEPTPGVSIGQRIIPVRSCCGYAPGGGYPLYSSALMLTATAKVAGVERIAMCAPTIKGTNNIHPSMLVAMDIAGATEIYAISGAHAIAAFAFGTEQIRPVDMIVGAGNQYVTEAKRQCYGKVGIDFLAGPSEILIIADEAANVDFIVADLLSESEHDALAVARLVTTSETLANQVVDRIQQVLLRSGSGEAARLSWENNGEILVAESVEEACAIANDYAPEHLVLRLSHHEEKAVSILRNFGSLLIGEHSAVVFSDYVAGANHILPTGGAAHYAGGVWIGTFCRVCTVQRISRIGAALIAGTAARLADGEGLASHVRAALLRTSNP